MTSYGTSYFKSVKAAIHYYRPYEANPRKAVALKLTEGSIHIGPPSLKSGEHCYLIDAGTRYAIEESLTPPSKPSE